MPAGTVVYYPVPAGEVGIAMQGINSYAARAGAKATSSVKVAFDPSTLDAEKLIRCEVLEPGRPKGAN
jgi:hypothetical protein